MPTAIVHPKLGPSSDTWLAIGDWIAQHFLADQFLWDTSAECWWRWTNQNHWEMTKSNSVAFIDQLNAQRNDYTDACVRTGHADCGKRIAKDTQWEAQKRKHSEMMTGIRQRLGREPAEPPAHIVATANGVLNLRDGSLSPHSPQAPFHITAVTTGAFTPDLKRQHQRALVNRFRPAMPKASMRKALGKALTLCLGGKAGGAQRGSVILLQGISGSGKTNTSEAIEAAFGTYALHTSESTLRTSSEINAGKAELVERKPRLVFVTEVHAVDMPSLLGITGGDTLVSRAPYRETMRGRLNAGALMAAVNPPAMDAETGLQRRLLAIPFTERVALPVSKERVDMTQDECDALVTMTLLDAITMWQTPDLWQPLPDSDAVSKHVLVSSDPLTEWLTYASHDYYENWTMAEIKQAMADALGNQLVDKHNHQVISRKATTTGRWTTHRGNSEKGKVTRLIALR